MSVTITTVRHSLTTQVQTWIDLDLSEYYRIKPFNVIELVTIGWTGGARMRTKRFPDFPRVYAYLKKLHAHGFLTDDSYASAWSHVRCVEDNVIDRRYWESCERLD